MHLGKLSAPKRRQKLQLIARKLPLPITWIFALIDFSVFINNAMMYQREEGYTKYNFCYLAGKTLQQSKCWSCADLGEGSEGPRSTSPLFWRILQKIYKKSTEMNIQMSFSGPLFPELGSPLLTFWIRPAGILIIFKLYQLFQRFVKHFISSIKFQIFFIIFLSILKILYTFCEQLETSPNRLPKTCHSQQYYRNNDVKLLC